MAELSISEQLVRLCQRPVDAASRQRAALHLLDWLGCALVGSASAVGRELARFQSMQVPGGVCFAAGCGAADAADAAFVNGGLGNIYEIDDVHRVAVLHAGDVVVPAALAIAQQRGTSAVELLDAIVCGYEVAIRIGQAAASGGYTSWYNSGTCGVFGAAIAAGRLAGLSEGALVDAMGQAGMSAAGIWQCRLEPTFSKQLACANAARNGVVAAWLASGNFPGARYILEGELGFFRSYYPLADVSSIGLDAPEWRIHEVSFKPWPACRHVHPAIEALLSLRESLDIAAIDQVQIRSYQAAIDFCDNPQPGSAHEARFSLQHCAAIALLHGEPRIEHFEHAMRCDPQVAALAARVQVQADARFTDQFPERYGASVNIGSGGASDAVACVDSALGDPENPLSVERLIAKFSALAGSVGIDSAAARVLAGFIIALPAEPSLEALNQQLNKVNHQLPMS